MTTTINNDYVELSARFQAKLSIGQVMSAQQIATVGWNSLWTIEASWA